MEGQRQEEQDSFWEGVTGGVGVSQSLGGGQAGAGLQVSTGTGSFLECCRGVVGSEREVPKWSLSFEGTERGGSL